VENIGFKVDLRMVFLTLKKVIYSEGINSADTATMEKFQGTDINV
jgi:hypothetical protein